MIYSARHVTTFGYNPAIRESVMEVRMQPRSEGHQRCLTFSLDVFPRANIMVYRDFSGNMVHHFDIPRRHARARVTAQALVEVLPVPEPELASAGDWKDLDSMAVAGDFWEFLLPSYFARPTDLLHEFASEVKLERSPTPLEFVLTLSRTMYEKFDYAPNSTEVDSPIEDALRSRAGVCQDFAHIMIALLREITFRRVTSAATSATPARLTTAHPTALPMPGWKPLFPVPAGWGWIPLTTFLPANDISGSPSAETMPTYRPRAESTKVKLITNWG